MQWLGCGCGWWFSVCCVWHGGFQQQERKGNEHCLTKLLFQRSFQCSPLFLLPFLCHITWHVFSHCAWTPSKFSMARVDFGGEREFSVNSVYKYFIPVTSKCRIHKVFVGFVVPQCYLLEGTAAGPKPGRCWERTTGTLGPVQGNAQWGRWGSPVQYGSTK